MDNWDVWQKHVLTELEELKIELRQGRKEIQDVKIELALLKLKSGIWGFAAGALPVIGTLFIWIIKNQYSS